MAIDPDALAKQMLDAGLAVLTRRSPTIRRYIDVECSKIARTIAAIELQLQTSQITEPEAKLLLDMQASATRSVLLTGEGLGDLAAEEAINAALDVARPIVNAALGFLLI